MGNNLVQAGVMREIQIIGEATKRLSEEIREKYQDRISEDYTRGDLKCPQCGEIFAREAVYHGKPANKIIPGKVYVRS